MHLGQRNGDIPKEVVTAAKAALKDSDDQWGTAMELASQHVGQSDPHLTRAIVHDIAVSIMARICMETRRKLRVYHGWELLDESSVVTAAHEGFVYSNGLVVDDYSLGVLIAPESSLEPGSNDPWVVVRYNKIWRAEINWDKHGYEGTVAVVELAEDDD